MVDGKKATWRARTRRKEKSKTKKSGRCFVGRPRRLVRFLDLSRYRYPCTERSDQHPLQFYRLPPDRGADLVGVEHPADNDKTAPSLAHSGDSCVVFCEFGACGGSVCLGMPGPFFSSHHQSRKAHQKHSPGPADETFTRSSSFNNRVNIKVRVANMTSLKRPTASDSSGLNLSSKVYVRSTKSGKVQKIVREVYLRQDIPCSSQICSKCSAPANAAGQGKPSTHLIMDIALV